MRRLHSTEHVSSRAPKIRKLIIDIFEQVSLSPYIFLYEFAAIMALVRTRNRHLVPNFWQCSFLFPTYLGRSKEAQCGPVVMALALGSRDPGFKSRSDHSLNVPGSPWFNFPAALVNSQLLCLRPVASLWGAVN